MNKMSMLQAWANSWTYHALFLLFCLDLIHVTSFVDLKTFTLIEGEKMKCKVIFRLFEMRSEVTEYFFF